MSFDVEEYIKNKRANQGGSSSDEKQTQSFDVETYIKGKDIKFMTKDLPARLNSWLESSSNYAFNYQNKMSGTTLDYTAAYDSSSADWLSELTEQKSALDAEREWLYSTINSYKDFYDSEWVESVLKALDDGSSANDSVFKAAEEYNKYWSSFGSEDAYNEWANYTREQKRLQELAASEDAVKGWDQYLKDLEASETPKEKESFWDKIGRYLGSGGVVDTTLPTSGTTQAIHNLRDDDSYARPNDKWEEDQKRIFGALYLSDPEKAYEYAIQTNNYINQAIEEEALKAIAESASSGFWAGAGHTAASIVISPLAGWADYLAGLTEATARGTITNDGVVSPFEYSQEVQGSISNALNNNYGTLSEDVPIIGGKGWGDVYGLGTSTAQSLVSGYALGPVGTLASYFGQGAASGMKDALSRGATADQALLYGTALGFFEGLAEMIGIDNLFKLGTTTTIKGFVKNVLKQAGAEGMEEGFTSLLSNIADNVIMGDNSNFNILVEQYMAEGMSESEAKKKAWLKSVEGIAFDTIAGAASGEISGSLHTALGNFVDNHNAQKNYGDLAQNFINETIEADPNNSFAQKMQAKLDNGKDLSGGQINRLMEVRESAFTTQDTAKIKAAVEQRLTNLGESGEISKLADIIVKAQTGKNLTKAERTVLTESKYGRRVSTELNPQSIESGEYASSWAENIGTKRINTEAYNKGLHDLAKDKFGVTDTENNSVANDTATTKKLAPEGKFKASDSGTTIITETSEEVTPTKIVSTDGGIKVELKDGKVVDASKLTFGTSSEAIAYEMVANMGVPVDTANALVNAFKTMDAVQFGDVSLAYQYGKIGDEADLAKLDLTDSQKQFVYDLGRADVKTQGRTWSDTSRRTPEGNKSKAADDGIIYEGGELNEDSLTDIQKASIAGIRTIAKMSPSLETHVFESIIENGKKYAVVNGKKVLAPNGFFRNGNEIYIDINAGKGTKGAMLYTMSHEIVHFIAENSFEDFKALADFLFEHYGKNNVPVDQLIKREIDILKKSYKESGKELPNETVLYMKAYEEVVANAMSKMLADPKSYEKLAKLKGENLTLWERIGEAIKQMLDKLKSMLGIYDSLDPDQRAADYVNDFATEVYEHLQDLYLKGFVNAEAKYQASIGSRKLEDFADAKNTEGDTLLQYKAMEADEDTYRDMLKKWGKMTDTQVNNLFLTIDKAMELIKENLEALDYAWEADIDDRAFSPVKPNSDKLYQVSLDFSTLCRKRLLQQTIQAHLQEALNKPLTKEEGIAIRDALIALQEEGRQIEVACALCYVESARMKSPEQIKRFIDNREAVIKEFFAGKSGGSMKEKLQKAEDDARERLHKENPNGIKGKDGVTMLDPRTAKLNQLPKKYADEIRSAKRTAKQSYVPTADEQNLIEVAKSMTVSDFTSPEGLENLAKNYPSLFDAYTSYVRNATKSKGIENDTWWRAGDSMQIGDVLIANMNKENGLRSQSWSDFQVVHILDYIAATIELATRETKEQAYTKVPDYAELMGNTGVMINLSLIPTAKFNGSLDYDSVEGIDYKRALALRDKYHATVGTICIGIDNVQIKMLLGDITIDYVIPYHKSGMSAAIRKLMHIPTWSQYEEYQSEKNLSRSDAEKQAKKYGVKLLDANDPNYQKGTSFSEWFDIKEAQQIAKMENANPSDKAKQKKYGVMYGAYVAMQNAANNYLKLCAERGISPKFSHEKADFTTEENYWKLLIDRKMVDNVTGEVIEQQTIKPIFDENEVMRILNDELDRYPKVKADQEYAIRKVTEGMLSGEIKGGMSANDIAKAMQTPVDNVTNVNILASTEGDTLYSVDEESERDFSYNELVAKGNLQGVVIDKNQRLQMNGGVVDSSWLVNEVRKKCKVQNTKGEPVYYAEAPDIGRNVEIVGKGLTHGFDRPNDKRSGKSTPSAIINAKTSLNIVEILRNSIEVNRSQRGSNRDVPYTHVLMGVIEIEDSKGNKEYYAVRSMVQERINRNPLLVEVNILGTLTSTNAKKIGSPAVQVGKKTITLAGGRTHFEYSIADFLQDVKGVFDDTFSNDVYKHFGTQRATSDFSPYLLYSEQDTDSVSTRSLLANALESVAQNDIEKNKLAQYKEKIALIEAEHEKLSKLRAEIKELSFAKGKRDTARINELQFQANQTANRINTFDRQLLNLESTEALKGVLEREKEMVRKREAQKSREALSEYREGAEKRAIRAKIKNFKSKMEAMLHRPTDRQYVPMGLANAIIDVCELINTDTDLYKKNGSINKAQERRELAKEKLRDLKDEYEKLKNHPDPMYSGEFDETVYAYLSELQEFYGGRNLNEMSIGELQDMYEMLRAIDETLADARKLIGMGDAMEVYEAGDAIVAEQDKITKKLKNGRRNAAQKARDKTLNYTLSPVRNVERMSDYNEDSFLLKLFKRFEKGIRKKNMFVMESYKLFDSLTTGKNSKVYEDAVYTEYGGKKFTDINGRQFGISKMQMMQTILSYEREKSNHMNHIQSSGFSFADLDMLRKGKLSDAISEEYSHRVPSASSMVEGFIAELKNDKWAQDYMAVAREFFNGKAKDAVNEASLAMKHRIIAKDKNYIPFEVDKNFVVREISAQNDVQQTINSYGMLKETKQGASQPLIITGLNNILDRHIDQVGTVHGLAIEVRNFNKVWNVRSIDIQGKDPTVKGAIQRNWGIEGVKHIEQAVQDIQGSRASKQNAVYRKIKSNYIGATFLLNLSVVTKQIGSLFSSISMLRYRGPVRMLGNLVNTMIHFKKISAEVDKYTATAWMRRQGISDAELQTLMTEGQKGFIGKLAKKAPTIINPTKWIAGMDAAAALSLWKYAKQDTAKRTGLKGEELLKATAEFYDEVVENTQSMTDVLHRPEVQKEGGFISDALGMFKTDLYQMSGQLQVTAGRFMANKSKENAKALGRTAYSIVMSAVWAQLMTTVFALLRYKVNQYRDDEDEELTVESWLKRQSFSFAGDLVGYIFPLAGSEFVGIIESIMYGESEDVVDNIVLTAVNDFIDGAIGMASSLYEGESLSMSDAEKLVTQALQMFGVPANNISRIVSAIKLHAKDIANGEFMSFEAGIERNSSHHAHRIVEAMESGKTDVAIGLYEEAIEELAQRKADKGGREVTDDDIEDAKSSLKTALGNKYKNGEVERETAEKILSEIFEMSEDDIYWTFDRWDYAIENGSTDDYNKYDDIIEALDSGDPKATIDEYVERKTKAIYEEEKAEAKEKGKDFNESKALEEAEKKAKTSIKGVVTEHIKPLCLEAFEKDDKTELLRLRDLLFDTGLYGKSRSEVYNTMKKWLKDKDE